MEEFGGDFFFSEGVSFSPPAPTAGGCRAFLFPSPFSLSLFLLYLWQRLQGADVVRELDPREVLREDLCVGGERERQERFRRISPFEEERRAQALSSQSGKKKVFELASSSRLSLLFLSLLPLLSLSLSLFSLTCCAPGSLSHCSTISWPAWIRMVGSKSSEKECECFYPKTFTPRWTRSRSPPSQVPFRHKKPHLFKPLVYASASRKERSDTQSASRRRHRSNRAQETGGRQLAMAAWRIELRTKKNSDSEKKLVV